MRRREFNALLGGAAVWPLTATAQQRTMPLIAILSPTADPPGPAFPENIAAFLRGLRAKGYIDGQNIKFEFRFAGWKLDQLPRLASELVALNPGILFTHTTNGVLAAKAATKDIPIVIGAAGELVQRGVIQSLARPGGNVTGLTLLSNELDAKRIEILKQIAPTVRQIAILVNSKESFLARQAGRPAIFDEQLGRQPLKSRGSFCGSNRDLFCANRCLRRQWCTGGKRRAV